MRATKQCICRWTSLPPNDHSYIQACARMAAVRNIQNNTDEHLSNPQYLKSLNQSKHHTCNISNTYSFHVLKTSVVCIFLFKHVSSTFEVKHANQFIQDRKESHRTAQVISMYLLLQMVSTKISTQRHFWYHKSNSGYSVICRRATYCISLNKTAMAWLDIFAQ